jgi:uncharacterized protein
MKIPVDRITESPQQLHFSDGSEVLNRIFIEDKTDDFRFQTALDGEVAFYRSGRDLFFRGSLAAKIQGRCSRCLKKYNFPLETPFAFCLSPSPVRLKSGEVNDEEMGRSFYSTDEIDLSPFIREQALLALPTRPLCDDRCRGLCVMCGANLNDELCQCSSSQLDPRMDFFRALKLAR